MKSSSTSISSSSLLQIALIVLKLCKVIDCSWWVVLIPTWISIIVFIIVIWLLS